MKVFTIFFFFKNCFYWLLEKNKNPTDFEAEAPDSKGQVRCYWSNRPPWTVAVLRRRREQIHRLTFPQGPFELFFGRYVRQIQSVWATFQPAYQVAVLMRTFEWLINEQPGFKGVRLKKKKCEEEDPKRFNRSCHAAARRLKNGDRSNTHTSDLQDSRVSAGK